MPSFIKTAEIGSDDSDNPFDDIPDLEELLTRSMAHKVDISHNALAGEIAALDDKLAEISQTCANNEAELNALNMLQRLLKNDIHLP